MPTVTMSSTEGSFIPSGCANPRRGRTYERNRSHLQPCSGLLLAANNACCLLVRSQETDSLKMKATVRASTWGGLHPEPFSQLSEVSGGWAGLEGGGNRGLFLQFPRKLSWRQKCFLEGQVSHLSGDSVLLLPDTTHHPLHWFQCFQHAGRCLQGPSTCCLSPPSLGSAGMFARYNTGCLV